MATSDAAAARRLIPVFAGQERPSERRLDAQRPKKATGVTVAPAICSTRSPPVSTKLLACHHPARSEKISRAPSNPENSRRRPRATRPAHRDPGSNVSVAGSRYWNGRSSSASTTLEHRRVGSDAQPEGENHSQRNCWRSEQDAHAESQILQHGFHGPIIIPRGRIQEPEFGSQNAGALRATHTDY